MMTRMLKRISATTALDLAPTHFKKNMHTLGRCYRRQASIFVYTGRNFSSLENHEEKEVKDSAHMEENTATEDRHTESSDKGNSFIVLMRGYPPSRVSPDEVMDSLKDAADVEILGGRKGIHFAVKRTSPPIALIWVELASRKDLQTALTLHKNIFSGRRYIEIIQTSRGRMMYELEKFKVDWRDDHALVQLRGLPFGWKNDDIRDFFEDLEIVPNGIIPHKNLFRGREDPSERGIAYVQFASEDLAEQAMDYAGKAMGHCQVDVRRSNPVEVQLSVVMGDTSDPSERSSVRAKRSPYSDENDEENLVHRRESGNPRYHGAGEFGVYLRGVPFGSGQADVIDFFSPTVPSHVHMKKSPVTDRPTGEAFAYFSSQEEVQEALKKHKEYIGFRYIEVYPESSSKG